MTAPMDPAKAERLALRVPEWALLDHATRLERSYKFPDFATAFAFVTRVAAIAEEMDHHPDIGFGWGYVRLSVQTHSAGGLLEKDFVLAARCDAEAA